MMPLSSDLSLEMAVLASLMAFPASLASLAALTPSLSAWVAPAPESTDQGASEVVYVTDTAGTVQFIFSDGFSCEVAQEEVAGCAYVHGLQEIAAASSPTSLCLCMPTVQQHYLRAWLKAVQAGADGLLNADAGAVALWLKVRRIAIPHTNLGVCTVLKRLSQRRCVCLSGPTIRRGRV